MMPSNYSIPQEEIVRFWWESSILEQPKKIVVLTMNITWISSASIIPPTHFNRRLEIQKNRLTHQNVLCLRYKLCNLCLWKVHLLSGSCPAHIQQLVNNLIHIKFRFGRHVIL